MLRQDHVNRIVSMCTFLSATSSAARPSETIFARRLTRAIGLCLFLSRLDYCNALLVGLLWSTVAPFLRLFVLTRYRCLTDEQTEIQPAALATAGLVKIPVPQTTSFYGSRRNSVRQHFPLLVRLCGTLLPSPRLTHRQLTFLKRHLDQDIGLRF